MHELTQLGKKYRLTLESGKTVTLNDAQQVVNHLNRFDMVRETEGLDILPIFFQDQFSYGNRAPKEFLCNNCKKTFENIKTIGEEESETSVCPHCESDNFIPKP